MEWNSQLEKVISDEGEKCLSYAWLHDRSQKKYNFLDTYINVPVVVLSTLAGSASIGSDTLFKGFDQAPVIIGLVSLLVGILQTLNSYFAFGKRSEGHRISNIQFSKIYNFIKIELSLPRNQRLKPEDFLKLIKEQLERLREVSPQVPDQIIQEYKKQFSHYVDVSKPEICNGLDKIEVYSPVIESKRASVELTDLRLPESIPVLERQIAICEEAPKPKDPKLLKPSWK
jgi:hypothetical protein